MVDAFSRFVHDKEKIFSKYGKRHHTPEEEVECFERVKKGDQTARQEIIEMNLGFIHKIALGLAFTEEQKAEYINVCVESMDKQIDTFDITKGNKFISYYTRGLKKDILKFRQKEENKWMTNAHLKFEPEVKKAMRAFTSEEERDPTIGDLIAYMKRNDYEIGPKTINAVYHRLMNGRTKSLDAKLNDTEKSNTLLDMIPNKNNKRTNKLDNQDISNLLEGVMGNLTTKERYIIQKVHFEEKQIPELADEMGYKSAPALRYHYTSALKKLKEIIESDKKIYAEIQDARSA